jgi:hypothetical protein
MGNLILSCRIEELLKDYISPFLCICRCITRDQPMFINEFCCNDKESAEKYEKILCDDPFSFQKCLMLLYFVPSVVMMTVCFIFISFVLICFLPVVGVLCLVILFLR